MSQAEREYYEKKRRESGQRLKALISLRDKIAKRRPGELIPVTAEDRAVLEYMILELWFPETN